MTLTEVAECRHYSMHPSTRDVSQRACMDQKSKSDACRWTSRIPSSSVHESLRIKPVLNEPAHRLNNDGINRNFAFQTVVSGSGSHLQCTWKSIFIKLQKPSRCTDELQMNCLCHWFLLFWGKIMTQSKQHFTYSQEPRWKRLCCHCCHSISVQLVL